MYWSARGRIQFRSGKPDEARVAKSFVSNVCCLMYVLSLIFLFLKVIFFKLYFLKTYNLFIFLSLSIVFFVYVINFRRRYKFLCGRVRSGYVHV